MDISFWSKLNGIYFILTEMNSPFWPKLIARFILVKLNCHFCRETLGLSLPVEMKLGVLKVKTYHIISKSKLELLLQLNKNQTENKTKIFQKENLNKNFLKISQQNLSKNLLTKLKSHLTYIICEKFVLLCISASAIKCRNK